MASSAPIEIWIKIFEEIIDVPEFFCSNPLTTYGAYSWAKFRYEGYYWRAERRRNVLRRVHPSWDALLNQPHYQHRFVRISDVTHGYLAEEEIPWNMTLRIAFGADFNCQCEEYCIPWVYEPVHADTRLEAIGASLAVMNKIVAKYQLEKASALVWRLRMVEGLMRDPDQPDLLQALSSVGTLTTIHAFTDWNQVKAHADHLRLLHLSADTDFQTGAPVLSLSYPPPFPLLTTLIIELGFQMAPSLNNLYVPALRHLQIAGSPMGGYQAVLDELLAIVASLGKNLRTFHYDHVNLDGVLPYHFWHHVPNLLQIRLTCFWVYPPPRDHPVKTIQFHGSPLGANLWDTVVPSYPFQFRTLPGWPLWSESTPTLVGVQHVPKAAEWSERRLHISTTDIWDRIFYHSQYREQYLWIEDEYNALGWRFTDYNGWTLNEFLVYILETRRDAKKMGRREWIPPGYRKVVLGFERKAPFERQRRNEDRDRDILDAELSTFEHF